METAAVGEVKGLLTQQSMLESSESYMSVIVAVVVVVVAVDHRMMVRERRA
jgi:hypothetical protein